MTTETFPRTYRPYGSLGCGTWTVQIARRGGTAVEVEAPASSVRMGRVEDDISAADVTFPLSDVPSWCLGAVADLKPWVYELALLRDGEEAWVGPISDRLTFSRSRVGVSARDLFAWMERRNLPYRRTFNDTDLSLIFEQFVLDALARDPSPNISMDVRLTGILADRAVIPTDAKRAADELRDLASIGVDFTMVDRTIRIRGRQQGDLLPNQLLNNHVLEDPEPIAVFDGLQAASEWVVVGATPAITRSAGGVGTETGLVTQTYSDTDITRGVDAQSAADELLAASGEEPVTLSVVLDPDAPFRMADLIPGNFIDTRMTFGPKAVNGPLMLSSVEVDASESETVSITLVRASSAPVQGGG